MAEEKPSLHIDTDWKKQAQEEKRKLVEQEAQRKAAEPTGPIGVVPTTPPAGARPAAPQGRPGRREAQAPVASFPALVQTLVTQSLFYMGELATRGGEANVNLDMARFNIDTLEVLKDKTRNNLSGDEQSMLNNAIYEVQMRFVSIAQQYAQLP